MKILRDLLKDFKNSRIIRKIGYNAFNEIPLTQKRSIFSIFESIFGELNTNNTKKSVACQIQKKVSRRGFCRYDTCRRAKSIKDGICVALDGIFKIHNLEERPSCYSYVTRDEAKLYYKQMTTIRHMETVSEDLYKQKLIRGFCHLCSGQEACATGIKAAMGAMDHVITSYRCHGWCYLMGLTPFEILAELTGHASGCQRGKGGSMHMYAKNFHGGNGNRGSQVPIGAGVSLFCKHKTPGSVSFILYGDGAATQGQVFETYNIAHLWKLPCIFVCENNNYGMFNKSKNSIMNTNYYKRGNAIPGIWVDGVDVLAVRNATEFAIDYVLKHNCPLVLELDTYRYDSHSLLVPGTNHRPYKRINKKQGTSDPIMAFKSVCEEYKLISRNEMKEIDYKVHQEVDEALKKVKTDKEVPLEELTSNVYVKCMEPNIRSTTGYNLIHKLTNQRAKDILANLNIDPIGREQKRYFQQKNGKIKTQNGKEKNAKLKRGKKLLQKIKDCSVVEPIA